MLYHLSSSALTHGVYLPTPSDFDEPRRATRAPREGSEYTWHFNPQGLSLLTIASQKRALLPHVFTLTLTGGYFLRHLLYHEERILRNPIR